MFEDSMLNENIEMVLKEYYQTVQREDLGANMWASPPHVWICVHEGCERSKILREESRTYKGLRSNLKSACLGQYLDSTGLQGKK